MNNRMNLNKLKKKMDARRKKRKYSSHQKSIHQKVYSREIFPLSMRHEDEREDPAFTSWNHRQDYSSENNEILFRKDRFLMQLLGSICLFFVMAIIFQSTSPTFHGVKNYVQKALKEDFQFSVVANWYEDAFGRPLALLPPELDVVAPDNYENDDNIYALPANGVIRQTFQQNGRGIYVETNAKAQVEAVKGGMVRFVGEDEEKQWGKVVVVSHYDGGEAWYGMLENIAVQLFDHVEVGDILGEVTPHEEKESAGVYYFALKKGNSFIDPIEVISFD